MVHTRHRSGCDGFQLRQPWRPAVLKRRCCDAAWAPLPSGPCSSGHPYPGQVAVLAAARYVVLAPVWALLVRRTPHKFMERISHWGQLGSIRVTAVTLAARSWHVRLDYAVVALQAG